MDFTFVADKHNFGKSVERFERASGTWYRKPRSIFWEQLLFGKTSSLRPFFSSAGSNGSEPLALYLFNLEIEQENTWLGYSREIVRSPDVVLNLNHFYSFGVILAYSFIFGIRDLHRFNLIPSTWGFQVVDVEVVLNDILLPNETALLPYKTLSLERSGAGHFQRPLNFLSKLEKHQVLCGFFDIFELVIRSAPLLRSKFNEMRIESAPVRVILRDTKDYINHLAGITNITDPLQEEISQIQRGDVPYFFKYVGGKGLYWVVSEKFESCPVSGDLGKMKNEVERHAVPISTLLDKPENLEKKLAQGAFLLARFLNLDSQHTFEWDRKPLYLDQNSFKNEFTGNSFNLGR